MLICERHPVWYTYIARNKDTCNLTMYRCFGISLDEQWPCTWFALKYNTIQKLVFGSELYLFKVARCLNSPRASNNLLSKYLSNPKWAFNVNICKIIIYHNILLSFLGTHGCFIDQKDKIIMVDQPNLSTSITWNHQGTNFLLIYVADMESNGPPKSQYLAKNV